MSKDWVDLTHEEKFGVGGAAMDSGYVPDTDNNPPCFDPEKVERLGYNWAEEVVPVGSEPDITPDLVKASDYDALLALYREAKKIAEDHECS